ncbi:undecaprenyl pyrophosphate synthetase [Nannochloropsis oceanica]
MASLTLLLSSRLLTSLFLCLLMAAFWSTTLAFVPPCCHSSSGRRQVKATTTRMMAERFYSKWSRADFVLKSALAAAAVIPVIKGGTMARDAQATERVVLPVKNGKLATDEDEEKDSPLAFSSAKGVPLRFPLHKSQEQALSELQEVVVRIGGRLSKARGGSRSDVLRAAFQSNDDDLYFRFGGDGGSSGYSSVLQASVALVLDGNGRWAQQRGLPRGAGHMEGTQRAFDVLKTCQALGIRTVTLYCLSTENWSRPQAEIIIILGCIENSLRANLEYAHKNRIRLVVIGQMHRLPLSLQALVTRAEAETAGYTQEDGMTVCLALSYGGRDDIVQACRALAKQVATGEVHPEEIDETLFESRLSTHQKGILRPPDLVVRTSGEQRWSNFMLFECAYSEFFVSEALWPDFRQENLLAALESYGRRRRRFGRVTECQPAAAATTEQQGGKADHGRV